MINKSFVVYVSVNLVNNKFYIGKSYKSRIEDGYYGSGKAIKAAFKKYGKENIETIVLFDDLTEKQSFKLEQKIIDRYLNNVNCYNIDRGGAGCFGMTNKKHKKATKKLMSDKGKNRKHTKETKIKMSESGKNKIFTKQHKKNISLALTGRKRKPFSKEHRFRISEARNKKVNKINPVNGDFIESFKSITEAAKSVGVCKGSISSAVRGNHKSGGFKWSYA